MSVESRRSYADKGGDDNHVKSLDTCRELSGIALFNLGLVEQPKYAYAIIPLACKQPKDKDGIISYNVRAAKSRVLHEEVTSYPSKVGCYYWPSGICSEPVFEAFIEDFIKDCEVAETPGDKLLSLN